MRVTWEQTSFGLLAAGLPVGYHARIWVHGDVWQWRVWAGGAWYQYTAPTLARAKHAAMRRVRRAVLKEKQ
jgi:hypothetical protein